MAVLLIVTAAAPAGTPQFPCTVKFRVVLFVTIGLPFPGNGTSTGFRVSTRRHGVNE
jgi:hypothetical protein